MLSTAVSSDKRHAFFYVSHLLAHQPDIPLKNVDRLWRDVLTHFRQASDSEQRRANTYMGRLLKLMQEYKDAYPAETADFDAAVETIPEFDRELARIERDDLPKYSERFRQFPMG